MESLDNISNTENSSPKLKSLFVVLNAGYAEEVMEVAREAGVYGATIIHARGAGAFRSFMGITVDSEKEIIFSVISASIAQNVMQAIKEKCGVNTPARCVSFLLPVDRAVGITVPQGTDS